jgi:hypothetical protein
VTLLDRAAAWLLLTITRRMWGMTAVLMPTVVRSLGPFGAIRWMATNIPKYERAIEDLGPIRANFVFASASLLNGCSYCVYAHARAFELYYFEKHGKLFPLDDHQFISLIALGDDSVRSELVAALTEADLVEEIAIFARLYALKLEGAEATPADAHLTHAIQMYDVLNYCAIESRAALDDAHDRVNKDGELKARYAEARLFTARRRLLLEATSTPSTTAPAVVAPEVVESAGE